MKSRSPDGNPINGRGSHKARRGAVAARQAHNLEVSGSNPLAAILICYIFRTYNILPHSCLPQKPTNYSWRVRSAPANWPSKFSMQRDDLRRGGIRFRRGGRFFQDFAAPEIAQR